MTPAGRIEAQKIETLVRRWADAVHAGDLDTVVEDHADDIVMFDVPPPDEGVRGLAAYRDLSPPFFQWQRQGASFEITELEVAAGNYVAFVWALLREGRDDRVPHRRAAARPGNGPQGILWSSHRRLAAGPSRRESRRSLQSDSLPDRAVGRRRMGPWRPGRADGGDSGRAVDTCENVQPIGCRLIVGGSLPARSQPAIAATAGVPTTIRRS